MQVVNSFHEREPWIIYREAQGTQKRLYEGFHCIRRACVFRVGSQPWGGHHLSLCAFAPCIKQMRTQRVQGQTNL